MASETDGGGCLTYPISRSSSGLFLYLSEWQGAFLAFISKEPFIDTQEVSVLDVDVVSDSKEARNWFFGLVGEVNGDRQNPLHLVDSRH